MAVALNADWNLAKVLYIQQIPVTKIAEKIGVKEGTLRQRMKRERWVQIKADAQQVIHKHVASTALKALPDAAKRVRQTWAEDCEETAQKLKAVKVNSLKDIAKLEEAKLNATKRTALTFAWNEQAGRSIINVAILNQASETPESITDVNQSQVVDVDTVASEIPSN